MVPGGFVDGEGVDGFAGRDLWQVCLFLRIGPGEIERGCAQDGRRDVRRGGQCPAHFLKQHAGRRIAHVDAALIFADQDAGPAHFGHTAPDCVTKTVLAAFIAQTAQFGDG